VSGGVDHERTRADDAAGDRVVIDTVQSIVVAFILAFVFRSFIIEAFVIPTGSMAPTLRGAHLVAHGSETGYTFAVGPRDVNRETRLATSIQGSSSGHGPIRVDDPMLRDENRAASSRRRESRDAGVISFSNSRIRMGDRILVLKYLYTFFSPSRFDVVVFKNPNEPQQNFIKRLIGLPGETIWLADGDVFVSNNGSSGLFEIQRKPEHVQRRVWQPVFRSEYTPAHPERFSPKWVAPWSGRGWDIDGNSSFRYSSADPGRLVYRNDIRPIDDSYAYNLSLPVNHPARMHRFAVSDIRLAAGVKPDQDGWRSTIRLTGRNHVFEAELSSDGQVELRMRQESREQWTVLETSDAKVSPPGEVTNVEFWHVDQALWVWVNQRLVAYATYGPDDWDANKRLLEATGLSGAGALEQYEQDDDGNPYAFDSITHQYPENPPHEPELVWEFTGSPVTLYRVELDRDLYYQPSEFSMRHPESGDPALATHPANRPVLNGDQFFVCGDNSPASLDGRLWGPPVPWVAEKFDPTVGVVPREMMLGKAFFVYFPSPEGLSENGRRFIPNFGEMRFIH